MIPTAATPHTRLLGRSVKTGVKYLDALEQVNKGYYINVQDRLVGPGVVARLIPENNTQPLIVPRNVILHTNAGTSGAKSLYSWITRATVNGEPHFQVAKDGTIEQYMELNKRADCNFSANRWLDVKSGVWYGGVSFETQDGGVATLNRTPWSFQQMDALVGSLTAICVTYGVHCVQPATWDGSGIGHHSLFPFQGVGSKAWTNVRGKTCPGAARIAQMDEVRRQVQHRIAAYSDATGWKCPGA
jgi:hypothetical protein